MATGPTITVTRGDDFEIPLRFWTSTAKTTPIDLTGCVVYFTVKPRADDVLDDVGAILKKTLTDVDHTDAAAGETKVVAVPADTKTARPKEYTYDIQLKDVANKVRTFAKGAFVLDSEITNRV